MSRSYLINANCSVLSPEQFKDTHELASGLMSNYFVEEEYLMCKVISSPKVIRLGESGQIEVSLLVLNSDYTPKKGQRFELREGEGILAVCECIDFILEE